jgi:hypothetical protein
MVTWFDAPFGTAIPAQAATATPRTITSWIMHGGEVLDSNCRTEFKAAVRKAGYGDEPWTAHTLRHFSASSAIAGGVCLFEVSRWPGTQPSRSPRTSTAI